MPTTVSLSRPAVAHKEGVARPDKCIVHAVAVQTLYAMLLHVIKGSTPAEYSELVHVCHGSERWGHCLVWR